MKALLVLQDGSVYEGEGFGAEKDAVFELVFNTSMTGYQEILTDPSYRGQGVLFTVPHLGNVGINAEDVESAVPQVSALVVRSISPVVSNWRAQASLVEWLRQHGIPGISEVATRAITRKLRDHGTVKAALSTCGTPAETLLQMARDWEGLDGRDMVREVTCPAAHLWQPDPAEKWISASPFGDPHIVLFDYGAKYNIMRHLSVRGAKVTVVPANTTADAVLAMNPQGELLSNGPGDPAGLPYAVETVAALIQSGVPIFGICLGHQLIGRALGAQTKRLKFGHHGGNHPVQDMVTRKVLITSQNHNYIVDVDTLPPNTVEVTHLSLNDGTLEGMRLFHHPVFSVQFHPEASPGPQDAFGLFDQFFSMIRQCQPAKQTEVH